jgi:methylated-DNA-protein-cysteine methyltransferase-like protein
MGPADRSTWTDFERAVGDVLDQLEPGDLVTYGDVAAEAGFPGAARAVGSILRRSDGVFPWWRVVSASGRLLAGHEQMQTELLVAEGIEVRDGRIRG